MNVDVREYELEEVTVKIIKTRRVITISANHKSQFESRSTSREFSLPDGTPDSNPDAIDVVLHSNGILTITGPCTPQTLPAAITNIPDDITKKVQQQNTTIQQQQQQNTTVQQQQQNTNVQRQQQNTNVQQQQQISSVQRQNTSVQEDTSVQTQEQIIQKRRYSKITRETFTSSTMTSLDFTEMDDNDVEEFLPSEPETPIEDITNEMGEDEDGNLIVELNVKNYRAEDIHVKASKSTVTIVGNKNEDVKGSRPFCKKIQVPADVVVTPDTIRSIFDKPKGVLIIIIVRKKTVTTTKTTQITDNTTEEQNSDQRRVDSVEQQVQQKRETVQETQTKTQQQINEQRQLQQKQVQQNQESLQTRQQVQQQDQRQQNSTKTTTTSKRTIKTTTTTVESLKELGYNFDSATSQEYTGDPKFFERATPVVDYKPEELEIKIAMPWVIVEGKQEMTAENGWRSKQFTKMFTVPEGVKQENIQLELNDAGDVVNCTARIG